jgi:hypothetical protein
MSITDENLLLRRLKGKGAAAAAMMFNQFFSNCTSATVLN